MKTTYYRYKCRNCGQIERRMDYRKEQDAIDALHYAAMKSHLANGLSALVLHECDKHAYGNDARGIADLVGVCFEEK